MGDGKIRRAVAIAALLLLGMLAACADSPGFSPLQKSQDPYFPVDTVFKEFYQTLGGQEILGPAISGIEFRENLQCQFTERALMCLNPVATDATRFSLYPLGNEFHIQEDPFPAGAPVSVGSRVVEGYAVYEKFLPLYDRLYGARYVGRPLTELRINQDTHRAEQFFENVGFYQDLNDPNGPVFLMPYGAYLCGGCSSRLNEYWSIIKSTMVEQPFAASVTRLGGPAVFGSLLLKPTTAADGNLEQAYTTAIFYAPPDDLSQVRLRPLPLLLNYERQPHAEKIDHDQLVFYEIENGLGHNVPRHFDAFITNHGGRDLAGNPISEVIRLPEGIYRQCFENYCLVYDPAAADMMKVRMAPLGTEYVDRFGAPEELQIKNIFSPERISLLVSVDKPTLNDNEEQFVRMMVRQTDVDEPLERVEATLVLHYQGQPPTRFVISPTDENGMSVVVIPPQAGVSNGSRLLYEVCLNLPSEEPICQSASYLIWNVFE